MARDGEAGTGKRTERGGDEKTGTGAVVAADKGTKSVG